VGPGHGHHSGGGQVHGPGPGGVDIDLGQADQQDKHHACGDTAASKERIFRLSELLKLQVSIVGSLEMARLAFRHTDSDLAASTQKTFTQARDLFQNASNMVLSYARVARQVSSSILPDLQLAVEEQEPNLAIGLLGVVKGWVADMKRDGDNMRNRYTELQESVLSLSRKAQVTKSNADRRLAEALRAADAEASQRGGDPKAQAAHRVAFELRGTGQSQGLSAWQAAISDPAAEGVLGGAMPAHAAGPLAAPLASMNSLTRQLFEQLGAHQADTGEVVVLGSGDGEGQDDEAWKRNVIDLLFLAPGAVPSMPAPTSGGRAGGDDGEAEGDEEEDDDACGADEGDEDEVAEPSSSVVKYGDGTWFQDARSAAETATNSSAALLRALRELRRVDAILQGCSAFWANMDGTVQKLEQMKDVTERLVGYASSSKRLRDRFEQRLSEYAEFWANLESLCRQYGLDHQAAAAKMQDFVRDLSDAADLLDTADSARQGTAWTPRDRPVRAVGPQR